MSLKVSEWLEDLLFSNQHLEFFHFWIFILFITWIIYSDIPMCGILTIDVWKNSLNSVLIDLIQRSLWQIDKLYMM